MKLVKRELRAPKDQCHERNEGDVHPSEARARAKRNLSRWGPTVNPERRILTRHFIQNRTVVP